MTCIPKQMQRFNHVSHISKTTALLTSTDCSKISKSRVQWCIPPAGFPALRCFKIEIPVQGSCSYWRHFLTIFDIFRFACCQVRCVLVFCLNLSVRCANTPYSSNRKNMTIEFSFWFYRTRRQLGSIQRPSNSVQNIIYHNIILLSQDFTHHPCIQSRLE